MTETADVLIIGAGIVGAACAEALSRDGLRVTMLESSTVGGGATAAGMGHIVVMDDSEAQFALTRYSRDLWNNSVPQLPPEVEFEARGTLWVAADEEEYSAVRQKEAFYTARGVRAEALDARTLEEAEPNLRSGLAGALLIPDDSVVYAPCAAQWLVDQARRAGATLKLGAQVSALTSDGVTLSDRTVISAGLTVCATGTWATALFPSLAMRPRKGHLAITDRYPGFVRHQLVELGYLKSAHGSANESVAFNVQPRSTGQVLIGSSRQFDQTHSSIDEPLLRRMLQRALEYMPNLAKLQVIRTWTGFRAATEDKLPVVGECPGRPGVYLATGHEGLGITTSLGTGQLLADLVMNANRSSTPSRTPRRDCCHSPVMPDTVGVKVNGKPIQVPAGATVAAAIITVGEAAFRRSVRGEPRGPLCGMGICFECRVTVDGVLHSRSCQTLCRAGMEIETDPC